MKWGKLVDFVFPYIEALNPAEAAADAQSLQRDLAAIQSNRWAPNFERALDEAQRVAAAEAERVKTSESKATTYLAVLAALVPVVITLQAASWEKKSGPAPEGIHIIVLAIATVYVAAAGYHAFRTLRVSGFQRIGEAEVAAAWRSNQPLRKLTRGTLLASRRSRDVVNAKVTQIKVTHAHLVRAFAAFVLLLLLDPVFYALGYRVSKTPELLGTRTVVVQISDRSNFKPSQPVPAERQPCEPGQQVHATRHVRNRHHHLQASEAQVYRAAKPESEPNQAADTSTAP